MPETSLGGVRGEFLLGHGGPPGPKMVLTRVPWVPCGGPILAQEGQKVRLEKSFFRIGESGPTLIKTNAKGTFRATQKARKKGVCINLTFFEKNIHLQKPRSSFKPKKEETGLPRGDPNSYFGPGRVKTTALGGTAKSSVLL